MKSVYQDVRSNLSNIENGISKLSRRSSGLPPEVFDMHARILDEISTIQRDCQYATLIVDCFNQWNGAAAVATHLATEIKATIEEIASKVKLEELKKELLETTEDRPRFWSWLVNLWSKDSEIVNILTNPEKASKIRDRLANLNGKISLLKPEIRQECKNLLDQPFQSHFSMVGLEEFLSLICSCHRQSEDKYANGDNRNKAVDFHKRLSGLQRFTGSLRHSLSVQDFFIHVADVAMRAAIVSCQWWASQFDPNMEEEVIIAISDLRLKVNFTLPEPSYQMLRLLKSIKATRGDGRFKEAAICFAEEVLPFKSRFNDYWLAESKLPKVLVEEIGSLTISIIPFIPDKDGKDEQSFLLDFNLLISEIEESFNCLSPNNGSLLLSFLGKVFLMRLEAFVVSVLTAGNGLLLSEKEIDALHQWLQKIKEFPEEHSENVNQILTLTEIAAKLLTSLCQSFLAKDITTNTVQTMLCLLRLKILHFKLERKLLDNKGSSINDSFLEGLKFLTNSLINQQGDILKDGALEVATIEAITRSVISLYRSILTQNTTEDQMFSVLQDKIGLIMEKLEEIYLPAPCSNFPKTNALSFFDDLLTKLKELRLSRKANLFVSVKPYFEEIIADLEFFRHFLGDILKQAKKETEEVGDLDGHVIDMAYEAEYVVDSIVAFEKSECRNWIWLYRLLQTVRHMKQQVTEFNEKKTRAVKVHDFPQISTPAVQGTSPLRKDADVLSLNYQENLIIDRLGKGCQQRDIVSIVGMPGIGKTTLAKKVYGSPGVANHFHVRAWCCVTEVYRKRELLLEILSQIIKLTNNVREMSDEDLEMRLRQLLLKNRYLIVMDDMWSSEAWDDLQASFPDDNNRSRILITSRLNDVVGKDKAHCEPLKLQPLSNPDGWNLLKMRIFGEESCPEELIEVGQEIAKACKGLPLAIVAMAGLLKETDRQQSRWKEIGNNISSQLVDNPVEQCRNILELSYKLLPDHLKACFLYFGAFHEDQEIPIRKLVRLWIAEGFVQESELKSPEDVAEDYLKDLVGRSLVIFAQPRSRGGTKACRIHDILRSLCQSIAKQDNFLQVITRLSKSNTPDDDLDFLLSDNCSYPSDDQIYRNYRLCFYSTRNYFTELRPSGPLARSLLFFATNDKYARSSYDISFISDNFRFLKVLDLESINIGPYFPSGIELMVLLRYLAVSGDVMSVPSSIVNLRDLETFVVKGLKGKVKLPDTIWCFKRLRHLNVSDVALIHLQDDELGNSSALDCLVTLTSPYLQYRKGTDKILSKFPNLRKLACIFSESPDWNGSINLFPSLDVLNQLETLKITYYGRAVHAAKFSLPVGLKKLTLSNFRLPWSEISVIGRLQNLQVLKLLSKAYDGETWEMVEGEFSNLKFLKLDTLNIARWDASMDTLPKLEQLVLRNCKNLEEVPASFVEIPTIEMIKVQWCAKSAEDSVRKMRDEEVEHLKIIIASDLDDGSLS